jgi:hypothetical protein
MRQKSNINAARKYDSRPGLSLNLQQQISDDIGVFIFTMRLHTQF